MTAITERPQPQPAQPTWKKPSVTVIIPAMNEAKNLPYVAERMPAGIDEIVFVDGNSVDDTVAVARKLWPAAKFTTQTRKGKGNALACGFTLATSDIVVMLDADGSTDPAEIPRFVEALILGADYAKGSRFRAGGGSTDITPTRRLGNKALNGMVNRTFRSSFTDLCYGYNAFWRDCIAVMDLPNVTDTEPQWGDGFEIETLINVRIATSGMKIAEVSSFESPRIHGQSNLSATRDGMRVLRTIMRERKRQRALRFAARAAAAATPITTGIEQAPDISDQLAAS